MNVKKLLKRIEELKKKEASQKESSEEFQEIICNAGRSGNIKV